MVKKFLLVVAIGCLAISLFTGCEKTKEVNQNVGSATNAIDVGSV